MTRYRCGDDRKADGPHVTAACDATGCRPRRTTPGPRTGGPGPGEYVAQRYEVLLDEMRTIHWEHPDYGSPRVTVELARRGTSANHKRVEG